MSLTKSHRVTIQLMKPLSIFGQLVIQFYPWFYFLFFFFSVSYVVIRRRKRKRHVEAKQIRHVLIQIPENKS